MLNKHAISQFLNRPRDDFRPYKKYSRARLNALCAKLPVKPPIWKRLNLHQKVYFIIGANLQRYAIHAKPGAGKTMISIALARYFRKAGISRRILVLVPHLANVVEWGREIEKHSPASNYTLLQGSTEDKWRALRENRSLFYVTTYVGLLHMVCKEIRAKRGSKMKMVPDIRLVKELGRHIDGMICDESNAIGNHRKLPFRVCRQLAKRAKIFFELSGTPFGKDPTPLWAQLFLIDWGEGLGENLGLFRGALFKESTNYFSGFPEYKFDKKKAPILHRMLAHRSLAYEINEADLPKVIPINRYVNLPSDAGSYYQAARDKLIAAQGNVQEMQSHFLRMRQISSGFLGYRDDESGEKAQIEFEQKPKLDALLALIEEIDGQYKTLIFHDFIYSGRMICRELTRMKIDHVWISGKTKNHGALRERYERSKKCWVMVINTAGAFGLNLQKAKAALFYESPPDVMLRDQMEKRFIRPYSSHDKVLQYDLLVKGTVDEGIRKSHKEGKDLWKQVIDGKKKPGEGIAGL